MSGCMVCREGSGLCIWCVVHACQQGSELHSAQHRLGQHQHACCLYLSVSISAAFAQLAQLAACSTGKLHAACPCMPMVHSSSQACMAALQQHMHPHVVALRLIGMIGKEEQRTVGCYWLFESQEELIKRPVVACERKTHMARVFDTAARWQLCLALPLSPVFKPGVRLATQPAAAQTMGSVIRRAGSRG